jgi:hypothetical protein
MPVPATSHSIHADDAQEISFPIPGDTPGGVLARVLNIEAAKGLVATIIHIQPGTRIPAHDHNGGAEANESTNGGPILTLQTAHVDPANPDFHLAESVRAPPRCSG